MSHTPGPWKSMGAIGGPAATVVCLAASYIDEHTPMADQDIVAMVPITRAEQTANLHLIATAPDLLAALEKIVHGFEIDRVTPYHLGEDKPITKAEAVKIARAAIAKATNAKG